MRFGWIAEPQLCATSRVRSHGAAGCHGAGKDVARPCDIPPPLGGEDVKQLHFIPFFMGVPGAALQASCTVLIATRRCARQVADALGALGSIGHIPPSHSSESANYQPRKGEKE